MYSFAIRPALRGAALAVALAALSATGLAQEGADEDPIAATVNGEEIRTSEVLRMIGNLSPQVRQMPPEIVIPAIAEQIAIGRLIAQRGFEAGLADDEAVKARVAEAERRIVQEAWLTREIEARIDDAALDAAYQQFLVDNPPIEEVSARHILVETEEAASDLITQLGEGADFATLATESSTDPGSAPAGGDLGYFTREQMVAPFAEAAFAMQPGETSATPVQTQFGWHVIRVDDRRMRPQPPLEEVSEELRAGLTQDIVQQVVAEVREGADIVIYGPDGQPRPAAEPPAEAAPAEEPAGEGEAAPQ
jgi:peptidyl-prolyl cis-trans isomerase C